MIIGLLCCALYARPAEAASILVTRGADIIRLAHVIVPHSPGAKYGKRMQLGYRYSFVGLFGLDLWTWDGHYVLAEESTNLSPVGVEPIPAAEAATLLGAQLPLAAPFAYRFPLGLVVLAFIFGAGGPVAYLLRRRASRAPPVASIRI